MGKPAPWCFPDWCSSNVAKASNCNRCDAHPPCGLWLGVKALWVLLLLSLLLLLVWWHSFCLRVRLLLLFQLLARKLQFGRVLGHLPQISQPPWSAHTLHPPQRCPLSGSTCCSGSSLRTPEWVNVHEGVDWRGGCSIGQGGTKEHSFWHSRIKHVLSSIDRWQQLA